MATPTTKGLITIKVTGAGASDYITIHNATQAWIKKIKTNSSGECIYNPSTDARTIASGDKIYVYANGRLRGNGSGTFSGGGVKILFTGTVNTISQAVNL